VATLDLSDSTLIRSVARARRANLKHWCVEVEGKKMDGPYALGDGSCHCLELVCPWRVASGPPATLPRSQAFGGCASTSSCAGRSYMCQPACLTLTRRAATPFPLNVARRRLPLAGNTGVRK